MGEKMRNVRQFNARKFIDSKIRKLNDYMRKNGLSGCALSVSGGIDSAVTYGLMMEVMIVFCVGAVGLKLFDRPRVCPILQLEKQSALHSPSTPPRTSGKELSSSSLWEERL